MSTTGLQHPTANPYVLIAHIHLTALNYAKDNILGEEREHIEMKLIFEIIKKYISLFRANTYAIRLDTDNQRLLITFVIY